MLRSVVKLNRAIKMISTFYNVARIEKRGAHKAMADQAESIRALLFGES
jgi:hypothetical protein